MKKRNIFLVLALVTLVFSCTDDFEEKNIDNSSTLQADPAFFFNKLLQNPLSNYQRNINLYPDFYSQYWANTVSGFASPRYGYVDGWIGNQWKEFYTQVLAEYVQLIDWYGTNSKYTNAMAQLEIWVCGEWARMSDTWGDMPYFEAGKGNPDVPYDSQQAIYNDLFKRLTKAVNTIDSGDATQYKYPLEYDLLFKGNLGKWKRFGNSLRLRLAMRLANVDPVKAQTEASAAIATGVMTSNADVAHIPLWSGGYYDYLHQMAFAWDNIRSSKTFTNLLYNQSTFGQDPRARKWFAYKSSSPLVGNIKIEGVPNGYNTVPKNANDFATINLDGGYVGFVGNGADVAHYLPYMFYSEVVFLQAEAALRGWVAGNTNELYLKGVKASMDYVGVAPTAATDYMSGLPNLLGSDEAKLKQLITQKYIANFPNGSEGWADFRRTDYPDITLPIDGVSGSASVS
ncbi:MAG: SusD/RagB family nutrient-binding outer membrane lipoprotein, partial [Polaribacter sp.]